tara:strand:- start:1276 stop:1806 length:531 start_codon:yes stop_codon:yes gene_type:complete
MAIETLKYEVLRKDNNIEIRRYKKYIAASVSFESKDEFDKKAFRTLADYIFGNNISMTSPVLTKGEKIGMTAPVLSSQDNKIWTMTFSMPSRYTIDTLPAPKNKRVKIKEIMEKDMAAIRFSGFMSDSNFNKNERKLINWLETNKVEYNNDFTRAGYNPPWTLPFFRRNEVLTTLK